MNQEKIWDYFQNNPEIGSLAFNADARYRFIANKIVSGSDVLNIGVGKGGLELMLLDKRVNVYCLDPNKESIRKIQEEFGLAERAKFGYAQAIPFDDSSFDVVVMSEVLEHLSDEVINKTVKECHRVLRKGGRFIGTVPADEVLLESRVVCPDCGKVFHRWGHLQEFSEQRLRQLLERQFDRCVISRHYFGNWQTLNWKGKISWLLKKICVFLGIRGSSENFFFSAWKKQ
jgi:ubiquinone/menaquinone biosynthesis C-methylase UbiE